VLLRAGAAMALVTSGVVALMAVVIFLALVRDEWPKLMISECAVNPAERRNLALNALAQRYHDNPPRAPVIAAGTTGSIPATAALLSRRRRRDERARKQHCK